MKKTIGESVWNSILSTSGVKAQLLKANELIAEEGTRVSGLALKASALYSWPPLHPLYLLKRKKALRVALECAKLIRNSATLPSAEVCDVVATILMMQPKKFARLAQYLYRVGLHKESVPHTRALLLIGLAESLVMDGIDPINRMTEAFSLKEQIFSEDDKPQAMRQWVRVLCRAAVLIKREDAKLAQLYWREALSIASSKEYGSKSQVVKLYMTCPRLFM